MNRGELLDEAKRIVTERVEHYGRPEDNFERISRLWTAYLGIDISAIDVAAMMVLLKLARISNEASKADSWIDLAGYAACGGEIATRESKGC